jgi:hypothetical protein
MEEILQSLYRGDMARLTFGPGDVWQSLVSDAICGWSLACTYLNAERLLSTAVILMNLQMEISPASKQAVGKLSSATLSVILAT